MGHSFLSLKIRLALILVSLLGLLSLSWLYKLIPALVSFALFYYFRKKTVRHLNTQILKGQRWVSPVSGLLCSYEKKRLLIRQGFFDQLGLYAPCTVSFHQLEVFPGKRFLKHFSSKKLRKNLDHYFHYKLTLINDQQHYLTLRLYPCWLGGQFSTELLPGDRIEVGAAIGVMPGGGYLLMDIPKSVSLDLSPGATLIATERI